MTEGRTLADVGLRMVAAGPDVELDDEAGFHAHSVPGPDAVRADFAALRARGWAVSRTTLDSLRERAARPPLGGFAAPPIDALFGTPVHLDDEVPEDMLRPVYIERTKTP